MLELQPGMVSKICESFKVLSLMYAGSFHNAQAEDPPPTWIAESDTRPPDRQSPFQHTTVLSVQDPTAIQGESINDTSPRDRQHELRTDAKISDAVCWNEQGDIPSVWRSQMHHLFLRLS
jgi:hypothetical protein